MAAAPSNAVVQGLLSKQNFPFFHKHLIDYRSILALGQPEKARSFERPCGRSLLRVPTVNGFASVSSGPKCSPARRDSVTR